MAAIRNEKTLIVFKNDLQMQLEASPSAPNGSVRQPVGELVVPTFRFRSSGCFPVLALAWRVPAMRRPIKACFTDEFRPAVAADDLITKKLYDTWQRIASSPWETGDERDLSAWIKALPQPILRKDAPPAPPPMKRQ